MGPPYISKILKYQYRFQRLFPLWVFLYFIFILLANINFKTENQHITRPLTSIQHKLSLPPADDFLVSMANYIQKCY